MLERKPAAALRAPSAPDLDDDLFSDVYVADEETTPLDLRAIWSAIFRNRWLILSILVAAVALAVAVTLLTAPTYRASASIQIDQKVAKVLGTEDDEEAASADTDRFLQTQVDVLRSRALAERVATKLRLANRDAFFESVGADLASLPPARARRADQAAGALMQNLGVNLPRNSQVVSVSYASRNPALAAEIANAFVDEFIDSNLQRRFEQSSYARGFLQRQIDQAKARLAQSEIDMIGYARQAGLIDASSGSGGSAEASGPRSLTTANLVGLNQSYSAARSARIQAEQRWRQAQSVPLMSLPEVLSNSAIQQLGQRRAELQAALEQERTRHKAEYPTVQQASASIAALDRQIASIAQNVKASIRENYEIAASQERAFDADVNQLKRETLSEQDRSVQYNILKREADTNRQLYEALLQRFKEINAEAGATYNNISVIDRAKTPGQPVSPRPALNLVLALLAGAALAGVTVFARERFDDAIRSPQDVEDKLAITLLGVVPLAKAGESPLDSLAISKSELSEAYHSIRTSLELSSSGGVPGSLLVTSSQQGEGKSTSAYAIAHTFATAGRRVLLVDADLRKPSLHRTLALNNEVGLSSLFAGRCSPEDAIQASDVPNLSVVTSGPLPPNPAQLLEGDEVVGRLEALTAAFDHVILDGPPVMGLADAPRLANLAHATIFVVEASRAHRGGAKAAIKRLIKARAFITGAVLTKFDAKAAGYGLYEAYYGYSYGRKSADRAS